MRSIGEFIAILFLGALKIPQLIKKLPALLWQALKGLVLK
jgi:hypothetical protein